METPGPVGWFDRSDRSRLEVRGPDRAKFLHNLTTHDVKGLAPGRGLEAFVTSPQGKTIGYVTLHAAEDQTLLRTDPGGLAGILPHFQKYGIFDDVHWEDVSARTFEWHLLGPAVGDLLQEVGAEVPNSDDLSHRDSMISGQPVRIICEAPAGVPGFTLIGAGDAAPSILGDLRAAGASVGMTEPGASWFEAARIAAGTPAFGRDVTAENLPQEVGRDDRAINFVKGCYLGQETVARIDALGHVNKVLRGLQWPEGGPMIPPGTVLDFEGKPAATVTSSALDPDSGRPIALAHVRIKAAGPGTLLTHERDGSRLVAVVIELPKRSQS